MTEYKFCSIEDVIPLTRIGENYTRFHTLIDSCISIATSQIQKYCRRSFVKQSRTEYFPTIEKCTGPTKIYLGEMNVANSPAPVIKLDYCYPSDWSVVSALDSTKYRIDTRNGIVNLFISLFESGESLQITYTGGWDVSTSNPALVLVDNEIKTACALHSAYLVDKVANKDLGQVAKNASGIVKMLQLDKPAIDGIVSQARSLLGPYRKQLIG